MSDLIALANQKLDFAVQERIRAIPSQITAVKAEHAAKGMPRSGATLKRARAICIEHIRQHGEAVAAEYKWVVNQALLASQAWTEELAAKVSNQLQPLLDASTTHLQEVAIFARHPELAARLISDVEAERSIAEERAKLAIRAAFAEKSRGLVRLLPAALVSLISKIFRFGS